VPNTIHEELLKLSYNVVSCLYKFFPTVEELMQVIKIKQIIHKSFQTRPKSSKIGKRRYIP
jgi:hypothetical protein